MKTQDQRVDLHFYKDVQERLDNITVEYKETPEDKDDEKYYPEHSESSSDNADTPEDHKGEEVTFLSKKKKITSPGPLHIVAVRGR